MEEFSANRWKKNDDWWGLRCRSCCVAEAKFKSIDPDKNWIGQPPKASIQILWERGWINAQRGQPMLPPEYTKERVGNTIVGMLPDHHQLLLDDFELVAWGLP
jgi:hypothetical protein